MKNRRNYYRVLQVQPDAPVEIIRASYRTLMLGLRKHPDLGGSNEMAVVLNEAYAVLSDAARRAEYDRKLALDLIRRRSAALDVGKGCPKKDLCPFCLHELPRKAQPGDRCASCNSPLKSDKMPEIEGSSRRSVPRVQRDDCMVFYTHWPQKGFEARLIDLSPKGTRFVCDVPLQRGAVVKIGATSFEALATVVNIADESCAGKNVFSIGASFIAVSFRSRKGAFVSVSA